MNPPYLRRTLGITVILLVLLICYRQTARGSLSPEKNNSKPLTVTAAMKHPGNRSVSPILVKGLLRKDLYNGATFLVDEDSASINPILLTCHFSNVGGKNLEGLADDTELVIEGWSNHTKLKMALVDCKIISINTGSTYLECLPEQ